MLPVSTQHTLPHSEPLTRMVDALQTMRQKPHLPQVSLLVLCTLSLNECVVMRLPVWCFIKVSSCPKNPQGQPIESPSTRLEASISLFTISTASLSPKCHITRITQFAVLDCLFKYHSLSFFSVFSWLESSLFIVE